MHLEDLVDVPGDGLLESGAVGLEEEVLVHVKGGETDADELEEVGDEGEAVDGLEHASGQGRRRTNKKFLLEAFQ